MGGESSSLSEFTWAFIPRTYLYLINLFTYNNVQETNDKLIPREFITRSPNQRKIVLLSFDNQPGQSLGQPEY